VKEDQNPFSIYDFLGYLIPGAFLCYGLVCFHMYFHGYVTLSNMVNEFISFSNINLIVPFVLISYISGHVVSYLSSITIERYSVWTLGYPSEFLFKPIKSRIFDLEEGQCLRCLLRLLTLILLLPITIPEIIFGKYLNGRRLFAKQLDKHLGSYVLHVTNKINEISNYGEYPVDGIADVQEKDYFRILYHYAIEKFPVHKAKMQNYVALYGFNRTVSLIFVIFFWISSIMMIKEIFIFYISTPILVLFAFLMYLNFVKFYRKFTLETYMAISSSGVESLLNDLKWLLFDNSADMKFLR